MKSNIAAELTIPQQTRYLVAIELGKVERHVSATVTLFINIKWNSTGLRSNTRGDIAAARP